MANQKKVVIKGKAQKDSADRRKFRIQKGKDTEVDIDLEVEEDGEYEVDKLSLDGLPTHMKDGTSIQWFNNFAIKKNGKYIKQKFKVTVPGLSTSLENSRLVVFDGKGDPYYYPGDITGDSFTLTNGDPAIGKGP
jgi:hypothetical protein